MTEIELLTLAINNLNTTVQTQQVVLNSLSGVFSVDSAFFFLGVVCALSMIAGIRR